ncbi:MAG: FAD-dependent oxidoreductase [Deltaproteobacteria bacterium]|nr:FAD-dependent oxidoreductase [Deltaproteobacteria bacterium]
MPYYIGDVITDPKRLIARTPEKFEETGIRVRLNTRVESIETDRGEVILENGERLSYDVLVMGTGAEAALPDIPGTTRDGIFTLKNLRDGINIKEYIKDNGCRRAVIVGAGFIAMEMSEALRNLGLETSIVYRGELPVKKWDPVFSGVVLEELTKNGVSFIGHHSPVAVERGSDARLCLVTDKEKIEADVIIFALGVKPNTRLVREAGLETGESGAIRVDSSQHTSHEEIFAVGDCCESYHRVSKKWVYTPLGDIANKQGRVAGRNIAGYPMIFPGIVGAQSFKMFDLEVAMTGLDERGAEKSGYSPASNIIWGSPVARSMNRGQKLGLKLIADRDSGKLLGAQAVGQSGAVSRINILSACLWSGMGLDEIGYMDLAYSPSFSGAWDMIHTAAQILEKKL